MQSEECGDGAGIAADDAHRYGLFRLAAGLPAARWRNATSLAFPPSDITAIDGQAVTLGCIGLLGMAGALPYAYTEAVARAGGGAAREFMDLLSAPAVGAFCDAWRMARPEHEPLPALPLRGGPMRGRALGELLSQALGVPVHVEQFAGRWEALPPEQCSTVGGAFARCGGGALLGGRLWRMDGAVRVVVGPLGRAPALDFAPGGTGALALAESWRALTGATAGAGAGAGAGAEASAVTGVSADACIRLQAGAASGTMLGAGARLGYDAMLLAGHTSSERDDLRYALC
ncbi:type VI secretion system baseplate subunit TssG [Pseudoduganella sp. OTU4001]|uniref:type VI secretion system baseplate subunit TssG n=1 Tax=Pseudoduganella sp. OTU4001 TaxID=3043854 RepID=UPI00313AA005